MGCCIPCFGRIGSTGSVTPYIKRRRLFLIGIVAACVAIAGLLLPERDPPAPLAPVIIMNRPYTIPTPKIRLLDRIMPQSRASAWLWRLRYALLGKTKSINLDSTFIDITGSDLSTVAHGLPTNPDFTSSDGLRVWRLKQSDLHGLQQLFK